MKYIEKKQNFALCLFLNIIMKQKQTFNSQELLSDVKGITAYSYCYKSNLIIINDS